MFRAILLASQNHIWLYVTYNVTKCVQSDGRRQGSDNVLELSSLEIEINKVRPFFLGRPAIMLRV